MPRVDVHTYTIATADCTLAVDEAGQGAPLILLHAGCADRRMWRHQLHGLSAEHRVISYDLISG